MNCDMQSDQYARAKRMIGYCLTRRDLPSMWRLAAMLHARLEPRDQLQFLKRVEEQERITLLGALEGIA